MSSYRQHQDPDKKDSDTVDETPKAQFKRGFNKWFKPESEKKSSKTNGSATTNGMTNGIAKVITNGNGTTRLKATLEKVNSEAQALKQEKLEAYFNALDNARNERRKVESDALEVWFMGAHADVGGGAVKNETRHMLSRIPLRWMIRQCFECDTGILFDTACLANVGLDVHKLWPAYQPLEPPMAGPTPALLEQYEEEKLPPLNRRSALLRIGASDDWGHDLTSFREHHRDALLPESTEDLFDARAPLNDQLVLAKTWWILEFWPVKVRVLSSSGEGWEKKVRFNMGRYRAVREAEPKMHWTVSHMVKDGKYKLRGRVERNMTWNIAV
jgi:hypothetical protein